MARSGAVAARCFSVAAGLFRLHTDRSGQLERLRLDGSFVGVALEFLACYLKIGSEERMHDFKRYLYKQGYFFTIKKPMIDWI